MPPVRLHDMPAHRALGHQPVMAAAQQAQVRWIAGAAIRKRIDVVNLEALSALASRPAWRDECALPAVAHEYNIPDFVRDVTRAVTQLPLVGVKISWSVFHVRLPLVGVKTC